MMSFGLIKVAKQSNLTKLRKRFSAPLQGLPEACGKRNASLHPQSGPLTSLSVPRNSEAANPAGERGHGQGLPISLCALDRVPPCLLGPQPSRQRKFQATVVPGLWKLGSICLTANHFPQLSSAQALMGT